MCLCEQLAQLMALFREVWAVRPSWGIMALLARLELKALPTSSVLSAWRLWLRRELLASRSCPHACCSVLCRPTMTDSSCWNYNPKKSSPSPWKGLSGQQKRNKNSHTHRTKDISLSLYSWMLGDDSIQHSFISKLNFKINFVVEHYYISTYWLQWEYRAHPWAPRSTSLLFLSSHG